MSYDITCGVEQLSVGLLGSDVHFHNPLRGRAVALGQLPQAVAVFYDISHNARAALQLFHIERSRLHFLNKD